MGRLFLNLFVVVMRYHLRLILIRIVCRTVIRIMYYLLNMMKIWFVDHQSKLFMKSDDRQLASSKTLWLIKASQSASAPRVHMHTPAPNLHGSNDDEYHGETYSFRGGRLHPIRGGEGRGGGGRGIPMQQ
jgi:hypothetical protein